MSTTKRSWKNGRVLKSLASLKLAVLVILALGAMSAWGTFVEAEYGEALPAQKLVYHSKLMYGILIVFSINLIAVMIDRWPWKERHVGFVFAHIGILIVLAGSLITRYVGVDGSMSMGIGENSKYVIVGQTDLTLYSSFDGSRYTKVDDGEVDFFLDPPTPEKPHVMKAPQGDLKVTRYFPYAVREEKIVESKDGKGGAAVRFQLQNPNVSVTEWLIQPAKGRGAEKDLGPAQVILVSEGEPLPELKKNTLVLRPAADNRVAYEIHSLKSPGKPKKGLATPGDTVETGWMGLVLRVLKYMPEAKQEISFKDVKKFSPMTTAAIEVEFNGAKHWLAVNSMLKLFTDQAVYIVAYANRRIDIGFDMHLKDFKIGRYQGTMRAATYESVVTVPNLGDVTISMNEPLKHASFTFYQASFQEDEQGRPIASVLSVNRDPGRWVKYLGSLLIVLGSIHLFYFKRRAAKNAAKSASRSAA